MSFLDFEVCRGIFLPDLKLVVHHAPVATCPASVVVVLRDIFVLLLKVTFQAVAVVNPVEWGFQ